MIIVPPNSIVKNAKGDITGGLFTAFALGNPGDTQNPRAVIEFDLSTGTILRTITINGIEQQAVTVGQWVDTNGLDDSPANPLPWDGPGSLGNWNYEISWDAPVVVIGTTGTNLPVNAQSYTDFIADQLFTVQADNERLARWIIRIRKKGQPATEQTFTVECEVSLAV
jgi:hypothetical protein